MRQAYDCWQDQPRSWSHTRIVPRSIGTGGNDVKHSMKTFSYLNMNVHIRRTFKSETKSAELTSSLNHLTEQLFHRNAHYLRTKHCQNAWRSENERQTTHDTVTIKLFRTSAETISPSTGEGQAPKEERPKNMAHLSPPYFSEKRKA